MGWQKFKEDYLHFSGKDRLGVVVLVLLIGLIYLLPSLASRPEAPMPFAEDTALLNALDTLKRKSPSYFSEEDEPGPYSRSEPPQTASYKEGQLFPFDPNTLDAAGWSRLGLQPRTVKTLLNYRAKGGRFYRPEDLQKIWGLPPGFYERVVPYIQLEKPEERRTFSNEERAPKRTDKKAIQVDINLGDSAAFEALPGIGSKLASRILLFRERLGGFHSVEQVGETFGLPDSVYRNIRPRLVPSPYPLRQLPVNTATAEELKNHPYLRWKLANAIVAYRKQHGPFRVLEDLKKIVLIDEATYTRILPYLKLE